MVETASNWSFIVDKIESILTNVEGTKGVYPLSSEDLKKILEIEEEYEKNSSGGSTRSFNLGLREVAKRQVVIAILKTCKFPRPTSPTTSLISGGEVVGEEIVDSRDKEELEKNPEAVLISKEFVMYRDRIKNHPASNVVFQFPPCPFPMLKEVEEIKDIISASPGALSDVYIKQKRGWPVADLRLGTILVGFNFLR